MTFHYDFPRYCNRCDRYCVSLAGEHRWPAPNRNYYGALCILCYWELEAKAEQERLSLVPNYSE